ncbi:MAG: FAD-dependent oxidoreductase [Gammaproteobacteria bacterium]|nr:FAD-dependent oxidoreductase [Gammaproteobacteria bacterium]
MSLPTHARVVIVGGGSLGVNLAYHLTEEGWTDIVLLEKGELTSGSTWHAAGLCPNFNGNHTLSKIHDYTIELYDKILPAKTGLPSSFHTTGSLRVAYSEVEEQWFRNIKSRAENIGCEMNWVSNEEAAEIAQVMTFPDARAILHTPNDGHVDPTSVVMPLGQLARENGATISRFNRVLDINVLASGEFEVITEQGTIIAQHVVNSAGCFAPEVGRMVGVHVPLVNLEHQYLVTDDHPSLAKLTREVPVVRDSSAAAYIRQEGNGFLVGPYETRGSKPWALGGMDWDFDRGLFEGDLERIMPWLERCMELAPGFSEVGVRTVINGAITHTPDDNFLCGPSAEVRNFWMLSGASIGIAQGGIGKYLAQWMVHGQTELNMASLDSRRFSTWADKNYCITRAIESYERMYASAAPTENRPHGRPIRVSPLNMLMHQAGAEHFVTAGFEKPAWFRTPQVQSEQESWGHTEAHAVVAEECAAVEKFCGITDLTGTAIFRITGPDAEAFLDNLSCNKLPQTDGRIGLSLFHAPNGGIMAEQSISRISDNEFILMGAIGSQHKDYNWLDWHRGDFDIVIEDITEDWGGLLLTGPKARDILQQITMEDLSNSAFPWLSCKTIKIDSAEVFTMRVSYAGELGWELHMPTWQLISIYESLMHFGEPLGLRNFGTRAFNSLRMEKAYRAYGHEFTEEISAIEAGMHRFIDLNRDFIGANNLRQRQAEPLDMQLAYLVFDDEVAAECFGNEAVYANGEHTGIITGGAYGYRVGRSLAFAYIKPKHAVAGTKLSVETSLGTRQCHVEMDAIYDPSNAKLRS